MEQRLALELPAPRSHTRSYFSALDAETENLTAGIALLPALHWQGRSYHFPSITQRGLLTF